MSKITEIENPIKVGITQGDFNGIGWEIIIKAFLDSRMLQVCTPIIYGSSKVASYHKKLLGINDFNLNVIRDVSASNYKNVNLINCWEDEVKIEIGTSSPIAGKMALKSLEIATNDLKSKKIDVLVTAPINKQNMQSENFKFPGHTEYLAHRFEAKNYLMLMVSGDIRIGTITGHIPLNKVSSELTIEKIMEKARVLNKTLIQDFGIRKPQLAILGLNPHAGDNGLLGDEEQKIIIPAITKLKEENILAFGPFSADGFFGSTSYKQFDGILAMYHDQGLIPFKTLSFESGVNYTAGLPIIRTSPDHGTAYEITGKNIASEASFRQAIYLASDIFKKREEYTILNSNPLKITALKKEKS